ncbi:MAG: hypothetical protein ACRECD_06765 [Burkholderiaceae bacterium]
MTSRRADAIVRCALDLGLRRSEVATLAIDDIDWRAGIVTVRRTKTPRSPRPRSTCTATSSCEPGNFAQRSRYAVADGANHSKAYQLARKGRITPIRLWRAWGGRS